jgi:hypothetical protein
MVEQKQNNSAPGVDWQTMLLRFTAFPSEPITTLPVGTWERVIGQPPTSQLSQPRAGELLEEGPLDLGSLRFSASTNRIEWLLTDSKELSLLPDDFPVFGSFAETLNMFQLQVSSWLADSRPQLQRIAFGAILLERVKTREEGYIQLDRCLPSVNIDTTGSTDLLYQINRPRTSVVGIPGLKVNRLSKWAVATWSLVNVPLNRALHTALATITPEGYALQLELDINTDANNRNDLDPDRLIPMFNELVELGEEIAYMGDIA